jgi:hypothetical protein
LEDSLQFLPQTGRDFALPGLGQQLFTLLDRQTGLLTQPGKPVQAGKMSPGGYRVQA